MKRLSKSLIIVALIIMVIVILVLFQSNAAIVDQFKYRIEATFEENGATITASGVISIVQRRDFVCLGICSIVTSVKGQATRVNFSNGKSLFVLLGTADHSFRAGTMPYQALKPRPPHKKISELPHDPVIVPPEYVPTIIYFNDTSDPVSAVIATPENLSALVELGARLVSISVKLTDDPVTTGIDRLLPWLSKEGVIQNSNANISMSHYLYPESDNNSKTLQSAYPRFLERNDW
ncbi:hypothetical protein BA011_40355 (plasmid) [Rhizobium leguminosarum]|uniref:Uncharacterized protein n=2 Tax=Rhizobium leguminosarum TaxID=384 RepID=A0A1B1CK76_RHILE|nr:hypothetical protein BA011_40355 [Rhizobium leguminosarum]